MPNATNNYTVQYSKKPFQQYTKATPWYGKTSFLVEDNFILAVEERIGMFKKDPYRYRNMYKKFYEVSVKKFPYLIIYLIDENYQQVIIFSIHHHKQNPKGKYRI